MASSSIISTAIGLSCYTASRPVASMPVQALMATRRGFLRSITNENEKKQIVSLQRLPRGDDCIAGAQWPLYTVKQVSCEAMRYMIGSQWVKSATRKEAKKTFRAFALYCTQSPPSISSTKPLADRCRQRLKRIPSFLYPTLASAGRTVPRSESLRSIHLNDFHSTGTMISLNSSTLSSACLSAASTRSERITADNRNRGWLIKISHCRKTNDFVFTSSVKYHGKCVLRSGRSFDKNRSGKYFKWSCA